jgi:hypothetical protein
MKLRNLTAEQVAALRPRPYPGFPEYTLLDLSGGDPNGYRRGASRENLDMPEAAVWERFILDHYTPPSQARLLVLHQCSWAKPYDMSATLQPVVEVCADYPFVHRLVVSNVGLVPAELQLNPLFCAYDWISLDGPEPRVLTEAFHRVLSERLTRYLGVHGHRYAGILALASRNAGSKLHQIAACARAVELPLFVVPDAAAWAASGTYEYRDPGDRIRHPAVLRSLRDTLDKISQRWSEVGVLPAGTPGVLSP